MAVKERVGLVVSDKMQKTVVVAVENRAPHPKYGKIVVKTRRYKAHDEENQCKVGDSRSHSGNQTPEQNQALASHRNPHYQSYKVISCYQLNNFH
jgi:hypothetical protein